MSKLIFITLLSMTSIASACKISQAGISYQAITSVTNEAFQSMAYDSTIKSVYKDATSNMDDYYIVEILDSKKECYGQMYTAHFDTLECKTEVFSVPTFLPIACK
jgi:hypothetical protein